MSATVTLPSGGGEMSSFDPLDADCYETTSNPGLNYDAAFARCGLFVASGSNGATSPIWAEAASFWFHSKSVVNSNNAWFGTVNGLDLKNGSGTIVAQLRFTQATPATSSRYELFTLQSGVLASVGSVNLTEALQEIDIHIVAGAAGVASLYSSKTQVFRATGLNHTDFAGVAQARLGGGYSLGGGAVWSEVIFDDKPHVGDRLKTFPMDTGSAVNTGYTGSVSDVDEIVYNDSTYISAATAGLVSTFYANGFTLTAANVLGVLVTARGNVGVSSPTSVELALRVGSTNYFSSSILMDTAYQAVTYAWQQNPATSAAWIASAAQAVEGGVKSIA